MFNKMVESYQILNIKQKCNSEDVCLIKWRDHIKLDSVKTTQDVKWKCNQGDKMECNFNQLRSIAY